MSDRQKGAAPGGGGWDGKFCHFFFLFKLALASREALNTNTMKVLFQTMPKQ